MDRGQAGILDGAGDQPGEDAGDQAEAEGNESGLSGFHVSVRSFAPRVGAASLPECDSLHQGPGSGAGEAAGVDYRAAEWRPDPPTDWGLEPSPEKLGDLFPLWLSEASFRSDQRLRAVAPLETPAASQPAALPAPERHDGLCPDEASGLDRPVIGADGGGLCMFAASVSARAGCGKPARPVRRGERQSCLGIGTSPTLPPPAQAYLSGFCRCSSRPEPSRRSVVVPAAYVVEAALGIVLFAAVLRSPSSDHPR